MKLNISTIMDLITKEFSISSKEIVSKKRTHSVCYPRQVAMFLARAHTDLSLQEIGRAFGNRDHTTVLYAVEKIKERAAQDATFSAFLNQLHHRVLALRSR